MGLRAVQVFHGFSQKDKGKIRANQRQSVAKKKMSELLSEGQEVFIPRVGFSLHGKRASPLLTVRRVTHIIC